MFMSIQMTRKINWRKTDGQQKDQKQRAKPAKPEYKTWDDIVNSDANLQKNWSAEARSTLKVCVKLIVITNSSL